METKNSRPRIAVFTKPLDNWRTGSGHHLQEILATSLDRNEGRFDFTFVHYSKSDNPIYTRARELMIPRNPLHASAIVQREKFDVVHYAPLTIYAPIWGVRAKKVATMHGVEQLLVPRFYGQIELAHERFIVPAYARRMDKIITVSETSARFFIERFRVKPERIVVCYNGISPDYRVLPASEIKAPAKYGIKRPFILHVSHLSERKNPWTLLDAFAHFVKSRARPHCLVCAGGKWNEKPVRDRAAELGISDRLFTPGFVKERDIVELMNAAEFFVFPSLAEGFGMPNVEAMACGCPVVTTNSFAIPEIVGDAAVVVDRPMDPEALSRAMARVVDDPGLRSTLIKNAERRLSMFSWERAADKLLAAYEELCRA